MYHHVKVKICGITSLEDAVGVCEAGADALGFVFWPESPRYIPPEEAGRITRELPPFVTVVGVFVDEALDRISEITGVAGLDVVQLHGAEPPDFCEAVGRPVVKAFRIRDERSIVELAGYHVSAYLLDTYRPALPGGTGETFNWELSVKARGYGRLILAGGLTPENINSAIERVRPYGVDVSGGVEATKGRKDMEKVRRFIERAKMIDLSDPR